MRGTAILYQFHRLFQGITPACAGNSKIKLHWWTFLEDHPRVCGEQSPSGCKLCTFLGSPPRVRGTVATFTTVSTVLRITPACAGNRKGRQHLHSPESDHPRVCGEQVLIPEFILKLIGSPPRVRGTVHNLQTGTFIKGITPACAGNSKQAFLALGLLGDHPRVCGEQRIRTTGCKYIYGSPPRVRGTVIHCLRI